MENTKTQWGKTVKNFSTWDENRKHRTLSLLADLVGNIQKYTGVKCFLSYGGLLGAVRDGRLIPHDFDIDFVFFSEKEEIFAASYSIVDFLRNRDFIINFATNGQLIAKGKLDNTHVKLELFAGWQENNKYFQYFAIRGTEDISDIFPLKSIKLEGVEFPAPNNPEAHLEKIYGENWRVPDPNFKYKLTSRDWSHFKYLFTSQQKKFWNEYYSLRKKVKVYSLEPSPYAKKIGSALESGARVLELGSGNGRDGIWLSKQGFDVTFTDYSTEAIDYCRDRARENNIDGKHKFRVLDVSNNFEVAEFIDNINCKYDYIYTRFFLHAVPKTSLINVFRLATELLSECGIFYSEYRCRPRGVEQSEFERTLRYENGEHYRNLISKDEIKKEVNRFPLKISEYEEGYGFAKFKGEDPFIARIAVKKASDKNTSTIEPIRK